MKTRTHNMSPQVYARIAAVLYLVVIAAGIIAQMVIGGRIVVDSDADLDDAVLGTVHSAFGYQGQKCSAASRVIVIGDGYEAFVRRVVEAARSLTIGMPEDPGSFMGPVIDARARYNVFAALSIMARHQHRHLWQAEQAARA